MLSPNHPRGGGHDQKCGQFNHGTLQSQKRTDGIDWFFGC